MLHHQRLTPGLLYLLIPHTIVQMHPETVMMANMTNQPEYRRPRMRGLFIDPLLSLLGKGNENNSDSI